jgi:hypothetical protein
VFDLAVALEFNVELCLGPNVIYSNLVAMHPLLVKPLFDSSQHLLEGTLAV